VAIRKQSLEAHFGNRSGNYHYYPNSDVAAGIASGSFQTSGMVVCACSMGTLAAISNGNSDNLLERAADVMLKEGRPLLLVPRETPLHQIHLENMLRLARMGVSIIPAMPAFYQEPKSVQDMVDFVVGKVLDKMGIDHSMFRRWGDPK
jgi:4-hydroxy-3-polyprenylbenzoate decarboxylase